MADPHASDLLYLDGLIEQLRKRAENVNTFWLKSIGKRIRELKHMDPSDAAGIAAIRNDTQLIADILDAIQTVGTDTVQDAKTLLQTAARLSIEAAPVAGDLTLDSWISGVAEATQGTLQNISNTTTVGVWTPQGFKTPGEAYVYAIDETAAQMASGKYGLNAAVRHVLKQFADSGLSVVEYQSGHTRSLGAAVEMNLKEATSQVYQGVQRRIGQEFGADGVQISAHWDCAPDHLDIQGRQFTMEQYERINSSLDRPIGTLNCRHTIYTIIIGVSEPNYSEEELRAMKIASLRKTEFDGKEMTNYEASQVQRRLEREIRKQKNRSVIAAAAEDDEMRREAQMKINQLTSKYKDLSDKFGIKTKAERMQVSGYRPVKTTKETEKKSTEIKKALPKPSIPEKTSVVDILKPEPQNVGNIPDMVKFYEEDDKGRKYAVSLPVLYNKYAVEHLIEDHPERLDWLQNNAQDIIRAVEKPEFIEKKLRHLDNGHFSATHIIKVSNSTKKNDEYMFVGISLSDIPDGEESYHQITTIYPARKNKFLSEDGTAKEKYKKL